MRNKTTEVGLLVDLVGGQKIFLPPDEVEASCVVSLAQVVQDVATLVINVIFNVVLPECYVFLVRKCTKEQKSNFQLLF